MRGAIAGGRVVNEAPVASWGVAGANSYSKRSCGTDKDAESPKHAAWPTALRSTARHAPVWIELSQVEPDVRQLVWQEQQALCYERTWSGTGSCIDALGTCPTQPVPLDLQGMDNAAQSAGQASHVKE